MSTKKKTKHKTIRDLSRPEKIEILKRVASDESIRDIAKAYGIRYASIRHVVIGEWQASFPNHFAAHGIKTITGFKLNPPLSLHEK